MKSWNAANVNIEDAIESPWAAGWVPIRFPSDQTSADLQAFAQRA
jgi:hypothetical protein